MDGWRAVPLLQVLLQVRTLSGLAVAAAISDVAVILALALMLVDFAVASSERKEVNTTFWPRDDLSFLQVWGCTR